MTAIGQSRAKRSRVAVVGAGFFSQFHLQGWAEIADAEVVALCDPNLAKATAMASRFGIKHTHASLAEVLDQTDVDLIDVVTPPSAQADVLAIALTRGVPVICQKPFGTSYAQACEFVELAKTNGVDLIINENFRFMPWYRELRRLIEAGTLGELHGVSFRLRPGDGQGPSAYLDRQPYFRTMPRLLVAETAIHFIDVFRYLIAEVVAVSARLRQINPAIAGEDAAVITFEFANGCAGVFDGNRLNGHPTTNPRRTMGEMWLEGSRGVMRLDGDARLWWLPHQSAATAGETEHAYDRGPEIGFGGGACGALQRHVTEALLNKLPIENKAHDYLRNVLVQEAVYASHAQGRRIEMFAFVPES